MDELLHLRYQRYLDCLAHSSCAQVIAYLQTLHARAYAPEILYIVDPKIWLSRILDDSSSAIVCDKIEREHCYFSN